MLIEGLRETSSQRENNECGTSIGISIGCDAGKNCSDRKCVGIVQKFEMQPLLQ